LADPTPRNGISAIAQDARDTKDRVSEVERPTGTSYDQTVAKVFALFEQLDAQVAAAIAANSYTRAQIDDKVNGRALASHTHDQTQITGVWDKAVNTTSTGEFDAGVTSVGVYNLQLTNSYKVQYVDSLGRMGFAPSTRRMKTQLDLADFTDEQIETLQLVHYKYTREIELERVHCAGIPPYQWIPGYHAGTFLGMYAEDLHNLGLWEFVMYRPDETGMSAALDESGAPIPEGIRYEMLAMLLIPTVQRLLGRVRAIEERLETAGI